MKMRTKFLISFVIVILFTVGITSTVHYIVSINVIKRNAADYSEYLIRQVGLNFHNRTADLEEVISEHFQRSVASVTIIEDRDSIEFKMLREADLYKYMNEVLNLRDYFMSVHVADTFGGGYSLEKPVSYSREVVPRYNMEMLKELDVEKIMAERARGVWFEGENGTIFVGKALYTLPYQFAGIVVIGIRPEYLSEIITSVDELTDSSILVFTRDNRLLFRQRYPELSRYYTEHDESNLANFTLDGESYISTEIVTNRNSWRIAQIIPVNEVTKGVSVIQYWTIITFLAAIVLAALIALFVSRSMTANVRLLLQNITHFSMDFTHKLTMPKSKDEVGLIAERFISMAEKIEELFNRVYREKMLKQEAEFRTLQFEYKALQAQMDPHFLYNTLESIQSLADIHGNHDVSEMIYQLGKLLRESIGKKGNVVYLREEIDFIRSYLKIHEMIYGDRISIQYDLQEEMMNCRVPKFILQPLVENSIKHGIESKPGKNWVKISAYARSKDLCIEVSDSGVGIDESMIRRLLTQVKVDISGDEYGQEDRVSVGIHSVQKRISILYGEPYGLSIESELNKGTSIRLLLPIIRKGETE